MKLLVGLGNPGSAYARQRHNVGFMALDRIAARHDLGAWKKRFHGLSSDGVIGGRRVVLLKPHTYMNDSGRSVQDAQRFLKIADADILVFHDELDLAPGKVRLKTGGGNAGHNGLRSITAHIGNDYGRVRLGIGHPGAKHLVSGYVLHDFAKADADWLEPLLDAIAAAAGRLAAGDEQRFLAEVARATSKPGPAKRDGRPDGGKDGGQNSSPEPRRGGEPRPKPISAFAENLKRWLKGRGQTD
ncbi:MAG TPA: aminoacyl-tRNA hydrolase [Hyphomicrobiaceae bacterium]|nr:aminoacyl-tRNA hydrolase [Hyphomicrobiaceae bacterium]